jgi:hypothetical protein
MGNLRAGGAGTRRQLLLVGGGLLAGVAAISWGLLRPRPDPVAILAERVASLFPEIAAIAPTVRSSPALARWGSDRAALAQETFGSALTLVADQQPAATLTALAAAVEQDFREERIVVVEGWSLAVTEARLVALIAASTPR